MVSKRDMGETENNETDTTDEDRRSRLLKTGIGIGIGSAAIVAALLYANRGRKKKIEPEFDD